MFETLAGSLADKRDALEAKLMLYIVLGIIAIVVVSLLLDGIRRYIRGLDTAALGALLIWAGYQASKIKIISVVTNLLYLIGGTLVAVGLLAFILLKIIRRKRARKRAEQAGPPKVQEAEKAEKIEKENE